MNLFRQIIRPIILLPLLAGGCDSSTARFTYDETAGRVTPESQNRVTRNLDRSNLVCADLVLNGGIVPLSLLHEQRWVDVRDTAFISRRNQISHAMLEWNAGRAEVRDATARRVAAQETLDGLLIDLSVNCEGGEFRNCPSNWSLVSRLSPPGAQNPLTVEVENASDTPVYALRVEFVAHPQERSIPIYETEFVVTIPGGLDVGETYPVLVPTIFGLTARRFDTLAEADLRAEVTAYAEQRASSVGHSWRWRPDYDDEHLRNVTLSEEGREQRFYERLDGIAELLECNSNRNQFSLTGLEQPESFELEALEQNLTLFGLRCSGGASYICQRASDQ